MIFRPDRDQVAVWTAAGTVPDDLSTRQYAARLLARLVDEHDRLVEWAATEFAALIDGGAP